MVFVFGPVVDEQTRCEHYSTVLDVVAIEFYCCGKFYPCYKCHDQCESHHRRLWPRDQYTSLAILCGVCTTRISIDNYLNIAACPHCDATFNPGCRLHAHLYFEPAPSER